MRKRPEAQHAFRDKRLIVPGARRAIETRRSPSLHDPSRIISILGQEPVLAFAIVFPQTADDAKLRRSPDHAKFALPVRCFAKLPQSHCGPCGRENQAFHVTLYNAGNESPGWLTG